MADAPGVRHQGYAVVARAAVAAIPLFLVPGLGATQGGFQPDAWVWAGALAAWGAALGLAVSDRPGALRREWRWVAAALGLLGWTLASALWSAEPSQSLLEARRMVVYAAVVLALVVLARAHSARLLIAATHVAISALVLYALARYLLGARRQLNFEGYLLSEPLGYANAVGILAVMGMLLSLAPAAGAISARHRAAGGALVPPLALALELSGSKASWLALAVGLAILVALHPIPRSLVRTVAGLAPMTALLVWVGHYSGLTELGAPRLHGLVVALVAVACAAAAASAAALLRPPREPSRSRRRMSLVAAAAVVIAAIGVVGINLTEATHTRSAYYHVAWLEYRAHPLLGSGAGTFGRYWLRSGLVERWGGALDAHSLYLETLAELGPIGLCLLGVFLLYPLRRAVARRGLPMVPAAAAATVAFLVHAGLDWDWELPAVVVAGLACAAGCAFAEAGSGDVADPAAPLPGAARVAALALALLLGAAAIAGARSTTEPSAASPESELRAAVAALSSSGAPFLYPSPRSCGTTTNAVPVHDAPCELVAVNEIV